MLWSRQVWSLRRDCGLIAPMAGRKKSSGFGTAIKILAGTAIIVAVLAGVGGYMFWRALRVEPIDADTPTAIASFTQVLNGEDALQTRALQMLAGAIERQPDDARAWLWFGLANMYIFIQNDELPYAIRTSRSLSKAVALDPANKSAEGWRAFFQYMAARRRGQDPTLATEALFAAGRADPKFSSFLVAIAVASSPLSSGLPQRALGPLEAAGDCGDGTTYSCRAATLHPHAPEGYHATLGDLKVRLGDLKGGQAEYRKALAMQTASTWPYRSAFEQWVEEAPQRAARLTNEDPEDDPPVFFAHGDRSCSACHRH